MLGKCFNYRTKCAGCVYVVALAGCPYGTAARKQPTKIEMLMLVTRSLGTAFFPRVPVNPAQCIGRAVIPRGSNRL